MSSRLKRDAQEFVKNRILLILAGVFFCTGLFLLLTFLSGIVDYTVDDEYWGEGNERILQYNKPIIIGQGNLRDGDVIYIEFKASNDIDIMVDTFENCTRYYNEHNSFEPFELPESSYKATEERSGEIKVRVDMEEIGIIFQKTPYSGYDKVNLNYRITYPDHFGSQSCLIIGLMFIVSGVAIGIIHFFLGKRSRRFDPLEEEDRTIKREIRDSKPVAGKGSAPDEGHDERPRGRKGKGRKKGRRGGK